MRWANFLHLYQPPTQSEAVTRRITDECYRTLVALLRAAPQARVTLNISGCLTEQLARWDGADVIAGLRELAEDGRVEFTGSAMYHAILPLLPRSEIERQIALNEETNRRYFGPVYRPSGFFPPEMCYSPAVAEVVAAMGFRWVIVDELCHAGRLGTVRSDTLYRVSGFDDFWVFFRNRRYSAALTYGAFPTAAAFLAALGPLHEQEGYLLIGTDGEIYGHHRPGQERLLEEIYGQTLLPPVTISDLFQHVSRVEEARPVPGSWSTWEHELHEGAPYSHWTYPGNTLQDLQWELTARAQALVQQAVGTPGYAEARHLLDQGLHSCWTWWASCHPWWSLDMIGRGLALLRGAVAAVAPSLPAEEVAQAQALADQVLATAHAWEASGEARQRAEAFRREHPDASFTSLSFAAADQTRNEK
ncbi:MAG: hypothetical protein HY689_15620 [Chloroflexi bacterium]|nr:hypothetical protein [Chloroflexota bacterium]